jgi:hypothetical protein
VPSGNLVSPAFTYCPRDYLPGSPNPANRPYRNIWRLAALFQARLCRTAREMPSLLSPQARPFPRPLRLTLILPYVYSSDRLANRGRPRYRAILALISLWGNKCRCPVWSGPGTTGSDGRLIDKRMVTARLVFLFQGERGACCGLCGVYVSVGPWARIAAASQVIDRHDTTPSRPAT